MHTKRHPAGIGCLLNPGGIGVGRKVVDAVKEEQFFDVVFRYERGERLTVIAHVDEINLAVMLCKKGCHTVRKGVLDDQETALWRRLVFDFDQTVIPIQKNRILVVFFQMFPEKRLSCTTGSTPASEIVT